MVILIVNLLSNVFFSSQTKFFADLEDLLEVILLFGGKLSIIVEFILLVQVC